jgi:protoheme IX farnesyltransferase
MVGAIPGALPPLIGYLAFTGKLDYPGTLLFLVQFFWQFAHFWAIAWILHDDYQKVGYWMLPTKSGRSKSSASQILIYTVILILSSMMPVYFVYKNIDMQNGIGQFALVISLGIMLLFFAYKLYQNLDVKSAKRLMFASLIYNPLIYLTYIIF